jgi:amino acid adenylation domain-containing protein
MVLLAAFSVLLSKYSGQEDIIIGSPIAGRTHVDLQNLVGLLMGGVMMRNFPKRGKSFREFLMEVKKNTLAAYEHQAYPLEELIKHIQHDAAPGRNPVTDVSLIVQNVDAVHFEAPGLELSPYTGKVATCGRSKLDLTLEVREPLEFIFEYRTGLFKEETIRRLCQRLLKVLEEVVNNPETPVWAVDPVPDGEKEQVMDSPQPCFPLSHPQKRIYYTEQKYPGAGFASLAFTVKYGEVLDNTLLEQAVNHVLNKHEGLRQRIVKFNPGYEAVQYVAPFLYRRLDSAANEPGLMEWIKDKSSAPFELIDSDLFYFAYVAFSEKESGYFLKLHHIISDGWTALLVINEIDAAYRQLESGSRLSVAQAPSYKEFIGDEQVYLSSGERKKDREFWHRRLLPLPEPVELSRPGSIAGNYIDIESGTVFLEIPGAIKDGIQEYATAHKTSVFKIILAALSVYISRVTGSRDFLISSASHNRATPSHKQMAGMFVSTLPLRIKVDDGIEFRDFVNECGRRLNDIIKHRQKYPYDLLALELAEKTEIDTGYFSNVSLIGHGDVKEEAFEMTHHFPGSDPDALSIHVNFSKKDTRKILELEWIFQLDQFTESYIRHMHHGLVNILDQALTQPDRLLNRIELVSVTEKEEILYRFNAVNDETETGVGFMSVVEGFERQVERTPDCIALFDTPRQPYPGRARPTPLSRGDSRAGALSYSELNKKADQLAGALRARGAGPGEIIAVMMEPGSEMIISLLGILKAGAAYLPLDPSYPRERIDYIVRDSAASVLLGLSPLERGRGTPPISSEADGVCREGGPKGRYMPDPSNLAYIIYTSGSTGRPKGVMIDHGNLSAYINAFEREFQLGPDDTVIQQASFTFDAFVEEMYPVLLKGGKLAIPDKESIKDVPLLADFMARHKVNLITCSPLMLNELNQLCIDRDDKPLKTIHTFISGGDVLKAEYVDKLLETGAVYNTYGPTETTVCATYYRCQPGDELFVPIGCPIHGYRVTIQDYHGGLLPVGIPGELCIGGPGVAKGYLNNPELTSKKFLGVRNPFYKKGFGPRRERFYYSGDRACWMEDGCIQFLGRMDEQVKIRGYRIEAGEIENRLLAHEAVQAAVVTAADNDLAAYIVLNGEAGVTVSELRGCLEKTLPDYMIPSFFVRLERLPLTAGGKVDKRALPRAQGTDFDRGRVYTGPRDEAEQKLAAIWEEVLGVKAIGIRDNFFELGGHSLKAARVVSRVNKELEVNISLKEIFTDSTIELLAKRVRGKGVSGFEGIGRCPEASFYALSHAQRRLWILDQVNPGGDFSVAYNLPGGLFLEGEADRRAVEGAFSHLLERHESLRTTFLTPPGENDPYQVVHPFNGLKAGEHSMFEYLDMSLEADGEARALELARRDVRAAFDLSKGPLIRVKLVKTAARRHVLIFNMHHIISDGWSIGVLVREFSQLYNDLRAGKGNRLPAPRIQYRDYAAWQNDYLKSEKAKEHRDYWLQVLAGGVPVLELPGDRPRPSVQSMKGGRHFMALGEAVSAGLRAFCLEHQVSLFMTLTAGVNVLLHRYSYPAARDIILGSVVAGRNHVDLEDQLGFYVNTLALRFRVEGDAVFADFLGQVKDGVTRAFEHQEYPFDQLVEELDIRRDPGRSPLFDVMVVMQNNDIPELVMEGLTVRPFERERLFHGLSRFDMIFNFWDGGEAGLGLDLEYNSGLFDKDRIERMGNHLVQLLTGFIDDPRQTLTQPEMLTEQEREQLVTAFNNSGLDYDREKTFVHLFEEQVAKTPDRIALVDTPHPFGALLSRGDGAVGAGHADSLTHWSHSLTYKQLGEQALGLARQLTGKGVCPGRIVAVKMEPCIEMIIGILGILKAGAAYLPIDPAYPQERVDYMLRDSAAKRLITEQDIKMFREDGPTAPSMPDVSGLAYIIYTSGSTGRPKGAGVEHGALMNLCAWHNRSYEVTEKDRFSKYAGFSFDASVIEIFPPLVKGAGIYVVPKDIKLELEKLGDYFDRYHVTIAFLPTPVCEQFMDFENGSLRMLITGGDKLKRFVPKNYRLVNIYGPTESTVATTSFFVTRDYQNIPIGQPVGNTRVYILDQGKNIQPVGVPGELYIGGEGLARGYINRPDLTNKKFLGVRNPFSPWQGGPNEKGLGRRRHPLAGGTYKMYRTGDLARRLVDGNIEFLGRIDHQVQINGVRVETGEIERLLMEHMRVEQAVVTAREDSHQDIYLCAYVAAAEGEEADAGELKAHLSRMLPVYMIPSYIIQLDEIPLTANGKTDRAALPAPGMDAGESFSAPEGEVEIKLAELWTGVLGLESGSISAAANFFEIGGHSLKATRLVSRVQRELGVNISLKDIFVYQTIRELAGFIDGMSMVPSAPVRIEVLPEAPHYALSHAQQRLWVLDKVDRGNESSIAYNIPGGLVLEGELDVDAVAGAFTELLKRHESLRTVFEAPGDLGVPRQKVYKFNGLKVGELPVMRVLDLSGEAGAEQGALELARQDARTGFDLSKGPLMRVILVKTAPAGHALIFNMHHIISDGWSMGVLAHEFSLLYNALHRGEESGLEAPAIQYKDYAAWQNKYLASEAAERHGQYWRDALSGDIPALELPGDFPRPAIKTVNGGLVTANLETGGEDLSVRLNSFNGSHGVSTFITMLAMVKVLLYRYTNGGAEDMIFGSPVAGRNKEELEGQIGFYINTLALRSRLKGEEGFDVFLGRVKESVTGAFEHQEYPFDKLVDELNVARDLSRSPLFDVMVVAQNNETPALEMDGLRARALEGNQGIYGVSKFDLTFNFRESGTDLELVIEFNRDIYKEDRIRRMAAHTRHLLASVLSNPYQMLQDLELLSAGEKQQLLHTFNDTDKEYPLDLTIMDLFERQAEKTPHAIALTGEHRSYMSYRELYLRSGGLALELARKGAGQETIVGVKMERSIEMMTAIFGIWQAGGVYLPLDPGYPRERIDFILKDSGAALALTEEDVHENVNVDVSRGAMNDADSAAYLIYTSGSTGRPKGVMVEHRSLVNRVLWMQDKYPLSGDDVILQKTPVSFDVSMWELTWWAVCGASLCLLKPGGEKIPQEIMAAVEQHKITTMHFVPSMLSTFLSVLEAQGDGRALSSLRQVFASGEALTAAQVNVFNGLLYHGLGVELHNLYGPTEAAIDVSWFGCSPFAGDDEAIVPIGKPIHNIKLHIFGANNGLQPLGVPGELCISGVGVARGYINRPELTHSKFQITTIHRFYHTGDLACWMEDGNIRFLGRMDDQVKVRGFRIEPGEIENRLTAHEGVLQAVVLARQMAGTGGDSSTVHLIAYVKVKEGAVFDIKQLREFLGRDLPDYMTPSYFVRLEEFPLTRSGKVDKKALPDPRESLERAEPAQRRLPANGLEKELLTLWRKLTGNPAVGVGDNFFESGGNSMLLVRLHMEIEKRYPGAAAVTDLFNHASIAGIAAFISKDKESGEDELPALSVPVRSEYLLASPAEPGAFEFALNGSLLERVKRLAKNRQMDTDEVLLAAFAYLLHEISDQEDIPFYVIPGDGEHICPVSFDFGAFEEAGQLLTAARGVLSNGSYPLEALARGRNGVPMPGKGILPVFGADNGAGAHSVLSENADFYLEVDTHTSSDTARCVCTYGDRLDKGAVSGWLETYAQIVGALAESA